MKTRILLAITLLAAFSAVASAKQLTVEPTVSTELQNPLDGSDRRTLVKYEIPSEIRDGHVVRAELVFGSESDEVGIMIEPAAAAWTTESTWPQIVLLENPSEGRSSQAGPGAAALVTEVLREWANNTRTNHGLVICQVDESARSIEVPSLCITYVSGSRH